MKTAPLPRRRARAPLALAALLLLPVLAAAAQAQTTALRPHGPILLTSGSPLGPDSGVVGGSGTADDPYVIEGWSIEGAPGAGVLIQGRPEHFVVRNLVVRTSAVGVAVFDSEHVVLESLRLEGNDVGVRATRSVVTARGVGVVGPGAVGFELIGSLFDLERVDASGVGHGITVRLGAGRIVASGFSGTQAGARLEGDAWVAATRFHDAPLGVVARAANVTIVTAHAEQLSDAFLQAESGAAVTCRACDLAGARLAARTLSDDARVDLSDSWLGPDAASRVSGPAKVFPTLTHPPRAVASTRAWGGDPPASRGYDSYLGHEIVRLWERDLAANVAPRPGALLAAERTVFAVDGAGIVHGLRASDGRDAWSWDAGDPLATIALGPGVLFVATAGELAALDAKTGAVRWENTTLGGLTAPVHAVVREASGERAWLVAGRPGGLVLVDPRDGTLRLAHAVNGTALAPAVRGDVAVVVTKEGSLAFFDLARAIQVGDTVKLEGPPSTPVVGHGAAFVTIGSTLRQVQIRDPTRPSAAVVLDRSWALPGPGTAPALLGSRVYVVSEGALLGFDPGSDAPLTSDAVGALHHPPVAVSDRVVVAVEGGAAVVQPGRGVVHRLGAGPPADGPAYDGDIGFLGADGHVAFYGQDVESPAAAPTLSLEGTLVRWQPGDTGARRAQIVVAARGGPWVPLATVLPGASVDLAAVGWLPEGAAVRGRGLDGPANAGPFSGGARSPPPPVTTPPPPASEPLAKVEVRSQAVIRANASGVARGALAFWNNGTAPARVELVGTVSRPPLSDASGARVPRDVAPGATLEIPYAFRVEPTAGAGRYPAEVRYAVDGALRSAFVTVVWDPDPKPAYRVRFTGGVSILQDGTASALLAVGNDGSASGNVSVEVTREADGDASVERWTLALAPGASELREVLLAARDARVLRFAARIVAATPPDGDATDDADEVSLRRAADPVEIRPGDAPTRSPGETSRVLNVSARFDDWRVEETGEEEFTLTVVASEPGVLALSVRDPGSLESVDVLDGPQGVGSGGEASFRVRVKAPPIDGMTNRTSIAFVVTDEAAREASADVPVTVYVRVAFPGTTTAQTAAVVASVTVASAGAAAFVGRENLRWLLGPMLLPLYTRIRRQEVLQHETRERMHALVEREPGVTLTTLGRELGLAPGVLLHHLHTLEREGYLTSRREGRHRRFFLPGSPAAAQAGPILTVAESEFLDLVRRRPGLSQSDIARELGTSRQLVNYHVKALARRGLVFLLDDGRSSRVYPVEQPPRQE